MNNDKLIEIRKANDIVEVISSYIPLVKKGKNYFCVCPFHNDNNPSMSISQEKQIYKCFSCGASGNVFNFIMDYENMEFRDALEHLANRAGISLDNKVYKKDTSKDEKYLEAYDIALKYYQNNLNLDKGGIARKYLSDRQITLDAIKCFKIGLSLSDKDFLTKTLIKKNYTIQELNDMGLSYGNNDLYQNRIMFPLFDLNGNVVAFSGRIYNSKSDSKYVNTKETKTFKKGELLYNYHKAKDECRKKKEVILVEGFMDVIRLYLIGIKNVVALMGTSLTKEQIALLRKLSPNLYLALDGDNPGRRACVSVGETLLKENFSVKVLDLKDGFDPDEYILKYGSESFYNLLNNALDFSSFKIDFLRKDKDFSNIDDKTTYINEVLDEISKETDPIKQELMLDNLSKNSNVDINILRKTLQKREKYSKIRSFTKEEKVPVSIKKLNKYDIATNAIIYYILTREDALRGYEKNLNYLPDKNSRFLANEIVYYYKLNGKIEISDFFTFLQEKEELFALLKEVLNMNFTDDISLDAIFEYFDVIKGYNDDLEVERLKKLMNEETRLEEKIKLAEKIRSIKIGS